MMKRLWVVAAVVVFCLMMTPASAGVIYVKQDSPGPAFDGKSWDTAYHKVQDGVNAASSDDEVWVAAGTYVENITLKDRVGLFGGFAGNESTRSQRDSKLNTTIIDGNKAGSVITAPNTSAATIVDGFTIRNGSAIYGGGVYGLSSYITITNNIITGNTGTQNGGGIYAYAPTVTNNTIIGNTSPSGGGVFVGGKAVISGNTISGNTSSYGAGVYCSQCSGSVLDNTIHNNTASSNGGAVFLSSCNATVANNVISNNSANYGGGIGGSQDASIIANNTIVSNTATSAGGGISYGAVTYITDPHPVANNIIAFNSSGIVGYGLVTLSHNCVYGNQAYNYSNLAPGQGDFSTDPKFKHLASNDYHLQLDSPCLDTGDDSVVKAGWLDMDGEPRIQSEHVDVGADEVDRSQAPYVKMPIFSVESGLCPPGQPVTITCPTEGAVIHYTTNGVEPNEADAIVESGASVVVTGISMTLIAKAWKDGYIPSGAKSASYTVADTAATPDVTPDGGYFESSVQVTVSCSTAGATIRYTTDGSNPTESSSYIASGSSTTLKGPVVLKVRAWKQEMIPSAIKTSKFTMRDPSMLRVNKNAAGITQDGRSWDTAYLSVQAAVNAAIIGDEIWVAAGTYVGRTNLSADISLYGGFVGTETERAQRNPAANVTTLDGNGGGVIRMEGRTQTTTVIDGFTMKNAAVAIDCSWTPVTISNNIISDNGTLDRGSAITAWGAAVITNNTIKRNGGGAVYVAGAGIVSGNTFTDNPRGAVDATNARIMNNIFTRNGGGYAAAVSCGNGARVMNNTFVSNAGSRGGAIECKGNDTVIADNVFRGNTASTSGGAIYADTWPIIVNNSIVGNTSPIGGGIYISGNGTYAESVIVNNIICYNSSGVRIDKVTANVRNNCVYGNTDYNYAGINDPTNTNGNISAQPLIACMTKDNYHIQPNSPCIDAGDNSFVTADMLDIDGEARIAPGGSVDIGADESYGASYPFAAMPEFSLAPGVYTSPQSVTISSVTPGATMFYTKDGSEPTVNSPSVQSGGIVLVDADCTLKAKAWKEGLSESDTASAAYRITGTVATPVFTPDGGSFTKVEVVQITSATPGATIRYTTDGSEPTESSPSGSFVTVDRSMTVKAKAWKQDWLISDTAQATFTMRVPTIYRVDKNAAGSIHDGTTWQTAFVSITDALNATIPGDEVWVAKGIYEERINIPYTIGLYGGFSGIETARSERNLRRNKCVLRASGQGTIVTIPQNVPARIDGFTICGAYSSFGITCYSSAIIANNRISGNNDGGILTVSYSSTITPLIVGNVITGNVGNGISADQYTTPIVCNNTIVGNSGEGLHCGSGLSVIAANNIIAMNRTGVSGANYCRLNNNCFYSNVSRDCDVMPSDFAARGNINADPKFASLFYGDLHIQGNSPCRNTGLDSAVSEPTDIDLQPRKQGTHVDIGAYESDGSMLNPTPTIIRVKPDGNDDSDGQSWARAKQSIGEATNALPEGGEVWVQAGQYYDISVVPPCVHVYGGFRGDEASRSQRDFRANQTIITRSGGYFKSGLMESTIDGFTVRNGSNGTGTACTRSRAAIRNNTYTDCSYSAISCDGATVAIENNIFTRNATAMHCSSGFSLVANNLLYNNTQAGIDCYYESSATIIGNTVVGTSKSSSCSASGINFPNSSTTRVSGNIVTSNRTGVYMRQPYPSAGSAVFCNNCIYGNSTNFQSMSNPIGMNGNISVDPLFMNDSSGDYSLKSNSPCIDTGDPAGALTRDLSGTPRPLDGNGDGIPRPDIGCYEYSRGFHDIGAAKGLADGASVSLTGLISTAGFQDRFYAETGARINGIGVTGFSVPMGKCVTIEGRMATVDGERLISAYNVIQGEQATIPAPLFMNPNALGGGSLGLQEGVSDWRSVRKYDDTGKPYDVRELVTYGGANNIGLLTKTAGWVSYVDGSCFYVDGGGAFDDGMPGATGIRVVRLPAVSYVPRVGDNVIVTGISSCLGMDGVDSRYARLIRPISVERVVSPE